jgi:hypothetical protein
MNKLLIFWRDLKIVTRSVLLNIVLFVILLGGAALLLHISGAYPQASWLELLVDAFHLAVIERVVREGEGTLPLVLTFVMPLVTLVILGEGVLRVLSAFIARGEHREEWDRMMAKMMQDHIVICGVGELGRTLVQELLGSDPGLPVVLLDPRADIMSELGSQYPNVCHIAADMTDLASLRAANCGEARMVFLTSGSDTLNLEAAFKVLELNPSLEIWVRLYRSKLAGLLDTSRKPNIHFFCPYQSAAETLARRLQAAPPSGP